WTQTALGSTGRYDMALVAYRDDGLLDPLFGMGGMVTHDGAGGGFRKDFAFDMTLDGQDRILITGRSRAGSQNFDMVVWRFR
ncbi:MAG: hypothetical protein O7H41_19530, partial [Planctomycetota bacterium]|nr:hypothetical protein [Planctomycetota bacterium]